MPYSNPDNVIRQLWFSEDQAETQVIPHPQAIEGRTQELEGVLILNRLQKCPSDAK